VPDFALEEQLRSRYGPLVAGIDEAGRGPWAGPVVACAVCLDPRVTPRALLDRLDDSKRLAPAVRRALAAEILASARVGVASAEAAEIDALNILEASLLAMSRAVARLGLEIDAALVDGNRAPALACPVETAVKGDGRSWSVAAASIVAKVTRDAIMAQLAARYPGYGWERNQGYGTAQHRRALAQLGVTPEHRRSFRPIRERLSLTV